MAKKVKRPAKKSKPAAQPAKRAAKAAKRAAQPAKPAPRATAPAKQTAKRPARPKGMSWLSPYLTVKDANAAVDFYLRAFGFKKKDSIAGPDGRVMHAEVIWQDIVIMLGPEGAFGGQCQSPATSGTPSPVNLYLYCDDVDALYHRATALGAVGVLPPYNVFWGDRMCKLTDPDGHSWTFATNVADFDPSKAPY